MVIQRLPQFYFLQAIHFIHQLLLLADVAFVFHVDFGQFNVSLIVALQKMIQVWNHTPQFVQIDVGAQQDGRQFNLLASG